MVLAKSRKKPVKYLVPVFHLAFMLLVLLYAWNQGNFPLIILCSIFGFIGVYYLIFFNKMYKETEAAVQASRAKSDFLATMSHEIRNPLNAVIGLSEVELRGKLPETSRDNIVQIHQSGSSLLGIINDILDISKIEAGGFELVPVEYETASLISDIVNLNKVRLGTKPFKLVLDINGDFPRKLLGDELRVRQVLNNILSNAVKYTEDGTIKLEVRSEKLTPSSSLLTFIISDTGIGIRREDMGKLFTSYIQLDIKANRKIEGTGLGLVITKNLVEMMGGNISVESEFGKGSVFIVKIIQGLPKEDSNLSPCIGEETIQKLKDFRYASAKIDEDIIHFQIPDGKVLVVDDLPVNLLVARGLLKPYGLQVDTAASGQEAIELVRRQRRAGDKQYDLIFMDHMMQEMDGVEAAKVIRAWENERQKNNEASEINRIPIVALTANALQGMKEFYLEQGFQDYITKPVNPQILDGAINRLIPWHLKVPLQKKIEGNEDDRSISQVNISVAIEFQHLDMLNHYRVSFESDLHNNKKIESDIAYFEKFTTLVDTLDTTDLAADLKEQVTLLKEAGKNRDVLKIREILPVFCEALHKHRNAEKENVEQDKRQANRLLGEILMRLKNAIKYGEADKTEEIMGELGTISLGPSWRELFFLLYDLLLAGDTEKALGAICLWERIKR